MNFKDLLNQLLTTNVELQAELQKQLATTDNQTDDDDNDGLELARLLGDIIFLWANRKKIADRQKKELEKIEAAADLLECRMAEQELEKWLIFESLYTKLRIIRMKYHKRLPDDMKEILSGVEEKNCRLIEWEKELQKSAEQKHDELYKKEHPDLIQEREYDEPTLTYEEPEDEWEYDEWER